MLNGSRVGLAFVLTALIACSNEPDEPEFDYGRDEMRSAIEGTWEGTSTPSGGAGEQGVVMLSLVYSSPDAQPRCNPRVLLHAPGAAAPLCMQSSSVNVTGTMTMRPTSTDAPREVALRGSFEVMSLRFDGRGMLSAAVDGRQLEGTLANDVLEGTLLGEGNTSDLTFSLRRRK